MQHTTVEVGKSIRWRERRNWGFTVLIWVLAAVACAPLFLILGTLIWKGIGQLSFEFFTQPTPSSLDALLAKQRGDSIPGGIANGILGTLVMVGVASVVAIPLGVTAGLFLSLNRGMRYASVVRFVADTLQATPSIVVGVVIYDWIVVSMGTFSSFAGAMALAFMMFPVIARSTEETLLLLPDSLSEAALALGAPRWRMALKVLTPSAFGGISTGAILAVARVMGETAPLMMTALGSAAISVSLVRPSSAVPLLIWEFYNDPNLANLIWGSSLLLLIIVLAMNYIARRIASRK